MDRYKTLFAFLDGHVYLDEKFPMKLSFFFGLFWVPYNDCASTTAANSILLPSTSCIGFRLLVSGILPDMN